jgi:SprT-like family
MRDNITQAEYQAFQHAYDFFNQELFAGALPAVLVTLQRKARTRGYFSAERFAGRSAQETAHELALNPDHFGRTDADILSTLVHEMAHVWQRTYGKSSRKGYHDREWAAKMKEIGLFPSSTGEPGGKETGQHVTHYIIADGAFAASVAKLQSTGFTLRWQSRVDEGGRGKKAASKTKYTCPGCGRNAWAKPGSELICGGCFDGGRGEIRAMEAV